MSALKADRRVAALMLAAGCSMRFVRSIYLREDNTSLTFFEAPSVEVVRSALTDAGVDFQRIGLALDLDEVADAL
jgi:hypothetical protein